MASGDVLWSAEAQSCSYPSSSYATPDVRNGQRVVDFDASTDEYVVFQGVIPRMPSGGITVKWGTMASSATSGAARWSLAFERRNTDADSDSFATAKTTGVTCNGTSGIPTVGSLAFSTSEVDGLSAGEQFRLKVMRDADGTSGTDDMTGDAELMDVWIIET